MLRSGCWLCSLTVCRSAQHFYQKWGLKQRMYLNLIIFGFFIITVWFVSCAAVAVCHELGHLFYGRQQKGKCLLLRVGWFIWLGSEKKLWFRPGYYRTPGCCVILCDSVRGYCKTAIGGIRANLGFSAASFWGLIFFQWMEVQLGILIFPAMFFAAASLFTALVNQLQICGSDGQIERKLRRDTSYAAWFVRQQEKCFILLEYGLLDEF